MRITRLALFVAPHAGAWIETQPASPESCIRVTSRLTQARGLKRRVSCHLPIANKVAPHAGAWIETCENKTLDESLSVAPHAGAWIETRFDKPILYPFIVAPHAGAWIETICRRLNVKALPSRLTQARGLKLIIISTNQNF